MSLSSILVAGSVVTLLTIVLTYIILSYTRPVLLKSLPPNAGSLHTPTRIGTTSDSRDNFFTPSGATVMVNVYWKMSDKTLEEVPILRFGETLKLVASPGGIRKPSKTTLYVKTQGVKREYETIDVQTFPEQKWVHLAIVREGRRYTIYYNGKIVGSNRTTYFPVIDSSQLIMGNTGIDGEFMYPKIAPTPLREKEVQDEMNTTSDTRNEPFKPFDFSFLQFGCPNGIFCFSTSSPPTTNPLKEWKTPYA